MLIVKILIGFVVLFIALQILKYYISWTFYNRYKKQGVVFNDAAGFSVYRDVKEIDQLTSANPAEFPWLDWTKKFCGGGVAPLTSLIFMGGGAIQFNSCEYLEDIYVRYNKFHTKHISQRYIFAQFMDNSVLWQDTMD
jgi:hypothetical protein